MWGRVGGEHKMKARKACHISKERWNEIYCSYMKSFVLPFPFNPRPKSVKIVKSTTGWHIRLVKTSCWHWFEICVLVQGPYTKTQLSNQCQREVFTNLMCHPVVGSERMPQIQVLWHFNIIHTAGYGASKRCWSWRGWRTGACWQRPFTRTSQSAWTRTGESQLSVE